MAALREPLVAVRHRCLRLDAVRPADAAARRLLHERHAGRHADRSPARRDRPPVRRGARTRSRRRRARQGVLRRAAAEGRADRRVGPRRRQPASRDAEGGACSSAPTPRWRSSRSSASSSCRSATAATAATSRKRRATSTRSGKCRPSPRRRRSKPCCRASTPCAPSSIRRTGTATTGRGRCAGDSIRGPRSAMRRAMPICASSMASLLPRFAARIEAAPRRVRGASRKSSTSTSRRT